jgi:hypothetical protein
LKYFTDRITGRQAANSNKMETNKQDGAAIGQVLEDYYFKGITKVT